MPRLIILPSGDVCSSCRLDRCLIAGMDMNMVELTEDMDKKKIELELLNRMSSAIGRLPVKVCRLFEWLFAGAEP